MSDVRFIASASAGEVSGILTRPDGANRLLVLGHGAGADMRHHFMDGIAASLAAHGVATLRYQFPYTERGGRRIDPQPILLATVRAAVAVAREAAPGLALFAGGKSMGGRMTSLAASSRPLEGVKGLVFLGFPLHPAGQPSTERAAHLAAVTVPMLFLQGTRDALAGLELLRPVVEGLGERATLHVVDGADHGFAVRRSSGRDGAGVMEELASAAASWMETRG